MEDTLPNEIADRDPLGGHTQGELEERLTCRRLVMYRQGGCQRGHLGGRPDYRPCGGQALNLKSAAL
jgi:hypothetical protein